MLRTSRSHLLFLALIVLLAGISAHALESRVAELRIAGQTLRASVELTDAFPENFQRILTSGEALYVRIQTELWEDRPLWDRLVRPALISVFRIIRDPATSRIAVADAAGLLTSYAAIPPALGLRLEVAPADVLNADARYYLRVVATIGTLAERDIQDTGTAVFGPDDGSVSLGRVGRFIFRAVLQVTDYVQSVSAETRSRQFRRSELSP